MRLKLIACEILYRECCAAVARSNNRVDVEFLPKGLHDVGQAGMTERLREALDRVGESGYDAVVLGYALCSNGVVGLAARSIPLVLPRAHDCITLFLGDKQRYLDYFRRNPGVYFKTSGWIERGNDLEQLHPDAVQQTMGLNQTYEDMASRYGEDNARFLHEQLSDMTHNYRKLAFIEMGIEPDGRFEEHTRREAARRQWEFEKLRGEMTLIYGLVDGPWDEDRYLVVPPGRRVAASFDEGIIKAEIGEGDVAAGGLR